MELEKMGLYGAIVGKAIYENKISMEELLGFLNHKGHKGFSQRII
jgi:phosphoribosylformimino-5-aminoimidazole carboxamide ribonucleotide (ProFAR) isomerase